MCRAGLAAKALTVSIFLMTKGITSIPGAMMALRDVTTCAMPLEAAYLEKKTQLCHAISINRHLS